MQSQQFASSSRGGQTAAEENKHRSSQSPPAARPSNAREPSQSPRSLATALHYALAVALTLVTLLGYLALSSFFGNQPAPIVFLIPVILSAYLGGLGPGLVSTFLGVLAAWYVITPPFFSFQITERVDYFRLALTFLLGALFSIVSESLHRAKERGAGDAVQRQRAEAKLVTVEQRFSSLFKHMLAGFAHCKMIFDDRGRAVDFVYLEVNPAFEKLTGLKNAAGKRVTELIPGIT